MKTNESFGSMNTTSIKDALPRTKYSHARRAADQHSIIFEEDLDSEGELERSTYYRAPVKNFILNEDQIGNSNEDESEHGQLPWNIQLFSALIFY